MTTTDLPRPTFTDPSPLAERLEWWQGESAPHSITARMQPMSDGCEGWVATRIGLYLSRKALFDKHKEILDAYPNAQVVRFSVSEFDWVSRLEKRGQRVL